MRIPFFGRKQPAGVEDRSYTDAIVELILARSQAMPASAAATSALEIAAGVVSRAFGAGRVEGGSIDAARFGPSMLADVGRDLIVQGESVWLTRAGRWMRAAHWEVSGRTSDPDAWRYSLAVRVPDGEVSYTDFGANVIHARYSSDRTAPWDGVPPLTRADLAGTLFANMEHRMGEEAGGSVGHLLPIPVDGDDASVGGLKSDLGNLRGKTALVETTAAGFGQGRAAAPQADYRPQRIGATFTPQTVGVYSAVQLSILAACGVPIELVSESEGTGQREAWRRFLHGTIQPLADTFAAELSKVTRSPARVSFDALFASDIAGRARAFQSMVGAGMDIEEAARQAGLVGADE